MSTNYTLNGEGDTELAEMDEPLGSFIPNP